MPFRDDNDYRPRPEEYPEPDVDDNGAMPCPYCFAVIHDEAVYCPRCGLALFESTSHKPWWILLGVLLCLGIALYWIFPPF